jgi:hypothetical protein
MKKKTAITAVVTAALILMITVPYISYATSTENTTTECNPIIGKARGIAIQHVDNETIRMPANLTLAATPVMRRDKVIAFKIVGGEVNINGTVYTISEGKGVVIKPQHVVLLRCKGTTPDGEELLLRLHAKYFWMGGHLYVARIKGVLRIGEDTRMLLLLRGAAKIP